MSELSNGDSPATAVEFRSPNMSGGEDIGQWRGLTKREAFAMAAMQGILSSNVSGTTEEFVSHSVVMADALLKELSK